MDGWGWNQRAHAHRIACVIGEHEEGGIVGAETTVQGEAVGNRAHAEFAHAVMHVVGALASLDHILRTLPDRQIGSGQIRRATDQFRQQRAERIQRHLRGLARGDRRTFHLQLGDPCIGGG